MAQFDNVSVKKKANVYFDGKCVSHTVLLPNGTRKTIGVIFPSTLTFNTASPEVMEINLGECKVRLKGEGCMENLQGWRQIYRARQLQLRYRDGGDAGLRLPF